MNIEEFWNEFLRNTNRDKSLRFLESFHFDLRKEVANHLLDLVLTGKKKATASSLFVYEKTDCEMPKIGDFSIITDWDGNPRCVIETTNIMIIPFHKITYEICKREGEDDTLESWQIGHRRFFIAEGKELGYEFSEDMPVIFEDFEVVYVQDNDDGLC